MKPNTFQLISLLGCILKLMEYRVTGQQTVHNHLPGETVEPDADWNVEFLLATGHLEPVKPSAQKNQDEPSEVGEL